MMTRIWIRLERSNLRILLTGYTPIEHSNSEAEGRRFESGLGLQML